MLYSKFFGNESLSNGTVFFFHLFAQIREAQRQEAYRIAQEQKLIAKQQQIVNHQAFVQEGVTPRPVDPFYSPILQRLDKVFNMLGVVDENCRERLVCAMYKAPIKYSPHSNYVSAELSR